MSGTEGPVSSPPSAGGTQQVAKEPEPPRERGSGRWRPAVLGERYGVLGLWVVIIVAFSLLRPETFPTTANFQTIFGTQAVQLVITLGLIVSLTAGEFDLSVASVMGFTATLVAVLNVNAHLGIGLAIVGTLLGGLIIGGMQAFVVVRIGVPSLITTLGTATLLTGASDGISGSNTIGGFSQGLINAMQDTLFGLPMAFYIGVFICLVLWYVLGYTPLGRHLLFVGEGREVARLAGLRVNWMRATSLIATTLICTVAGIMQAGAVGAVDPDAGSSFLLPAFASAYLGQTVINPGRFSPLGVFVATYFLVTGITGLQLLGGSGWVQNVFYGSALVIAVSVSRLVARRRQV